MIEPKVGDVWQTGSVAKYVSDVICVDLQENIACIRSCVNGEFSMRSFGDFHEHYELIERDGKRGTELWEQFEYQECPQWYKDKLAKAVEDGYIVQCLQGDDVWLDCRPKGMLRRGKPGPSGRYRITNRKITPQPQKEPEKSNKFKLFEIRWGKRSPRILDGAPCSIGSKVPAEPYRIFGFTDNPNWAEDGSYYIVNDEKCLFPAAYFKNPCDLDTNHKYAIGRLEV